MAASHNEQLGRVKRVIRQACWRRRVGRNMAAPSSAGLSVAVLDRAVSGERRRLAGRRSLSLMGRAAGRLYNTVIRYRHTIPCTCALSPTVLATFRPTGESSFDIIYKLLPYSTSSQAAQGKETAPGLPLPRILAPSSEPVRNGPEMCPQGLRQIVHGSRRRVQIPSRPARVP